MYRSQGDKPFIAIGNRLYRACVQPLGYPSLAYFEHLCRLGWGNTLHTHAHLVGNDDRYADACEIPFAAPEPGGRQFVAIIQTGGNGSLSAS